MRMEVSVKSIGKVLMTIFGISFILLGTLALVYYAQGYRLSRDLVDLQKTGVLSIESNPSRADIYIDGRLVGRSPKTITSLKEGTYDVELLRDDHLPWKADIEIKAGRSTPIYPFLFLKEPKVETVFKLDSNLRTATAPENANYVFLVTEKVIPQNLARPTSQPEGSQQPEEQLPLIDQSDTQAQTTTGLFESILYKIWRYETNPSFWSTQQNPRLVFEMSIPNATDLELIMSHKGENAIIVIKSDENGNIAYSTFLIETKLVNDPKPIDLAAFVDEYSISWSQNDEYLLLESPSEILSYNINTDTKYLLMRKSGDLIWSTDEVGHFLRLEEEFDEDLDRPYQRIIRSTLTGSMSEVLVDRIYFRDDDELMTENEKLQQRDGLYTFTNSPTSTQFAGKIMRFSSQPSLGQILIETEYGLYIYLLSDNKYILVSATEGEFLHYSPNKRMIIFNNNDGLNLFTFEKDTADHTTMLGPDLLIEDVDLKGKHIKWHTNSNILYYLKDETVKSIDIQGNNENVLYMFVDETFFTDNSGNNLLGISTDELGIPQLDKVRVH
jgi:hypothetical protein